MGYLFLIAFAKRLFPFLGPIGAIVLLQLLVHIIFSYLLVSKFDNIKNKIAFIFFYYLNPIVLYFTIYPFYYFWQVIPSFIVLLILNEKENKLFSSFLFLGASCGTQNPHRTWKDRMLSITSKTLSVAGVGVEPTTFWL